MVYCLAKNALKSILSWNNKNSNAFDGMQNEAATKEISCAIISVHLIIRVYMCNYSKGRFWDGPREFLSFFKRVMDGTSSFVT